MSKHTHLYRATPGAGWKCIHCDHPTVTPPPMEQRAAYQERLRAEVAHLEKHGLSRYFTLPHDIPKET